LRAVHFTRFGVLAPIEPALLDEGRQAAKPGDVVARGKSAFGDLEARLDGERAAGLVDLEQPERGAKVVQAPAAGAELVANVERFGEMRLDVGNRALLGVAPVLKQ